MSGRELEGQTQARFGLNGNRAGRVGHLLLVDVSVGLLQRLHHQSLSVHVGLGGGGGRAGVDLGGAGRGGRGDEDVRGGGGRGHRGDGAGLAEAGGREEELGDREGGRRGGGRREGRGRGRRHVGLGPGFEADAGEGGCGGLGVRAHFVLHGLLLLWLYLLLLRCGLLGGLGKLWLLLLLGLLNNGEGN